MAKKPWQSKTLWTNLIIAALVLFVPGLDEVLKDNQALSVSLVAAINGVLRLATDEPIRLR
jgi:hypothetical protein